MREGEVLGGRFELTTVAGRGGMGTVYRAVDRELGGLVAVKVLSHTGPEATHRFAHEVQILAELSHPHIVQLVAHGTTPEEEPYLVMQWLDGESLEARLSRQRLGLAESLALLRALASALAVAHRGGVVHRDIKPSNVFLRAGQIEGATLLDFGVARIAGRPTVLTRSGGIIGTPGYMSPEQARGDTENIDARADVFSLGAVLFECLTGRPVFQAAHVAALLAKVLWEEAPRLRELVPDAPPALERLVARMLAKDAAERPADAKAVLDALDRLADGDADPVGRSPPDTLTRTEKRLVSVIALLQRSLPPARGSAVTLTRTDMPRRLLPDVRAIVGPFGARVEELANGMLVALLVGAGNALDQAALAARAALRLRARLPEARLVLVTGWAEGGGRLPVGEVLERAGALLAGAAARDPALRFAPSKPPPPRPSDPAPEGAPGGAAGVRYTPVRIDGITRALLEGRFDVVSRVDASGEEEAIVLRGERDAGEQARLLLGKPSTFVGRDRELRLLLDLVEESFAEGRAQAILVTGDAGMGKSRIRDELLRRVREARSDVAIGTGGGDAINAGSAFGMIASALRSSLQIPAGEPLSVQREKLASGVGLVVEGPERQRVTELLGELIGAPFPDEASPRLRGARQHASIMADQIRSAFLAYARALALRGPTMLVFEDLQWGDGPSVRLADMALRDLRDLPFVVVAFARPGVHELFPRLWEGRELHEIRLGALPRRAAMELVRGALGDRIDEARAQDIVERAGGNAFYLEELVRAAARGRRDGLPETILGMVEARLSTLSPEMRRTLRAASVFGRVFWKGAVLALLGEEDGGGGDGAFADLVEHELLVRHPDSQLAGEEQYAFRHVLIRDCAYAMLTDRDRALAHRRAAAWLEQAGETDATTLAAHHERGGEPMRAGAFYLRAAELAHRAGDTAAAMSRAERGIACGVPEDLTLALLGLLSELHIWRNEWGIAANYGDEVFRLARRGSTPWVRAATARLVDSMNRGEVDEALRLLDAVCDAGPGEDAVDPAALALALGVVFLVTMGRPPLAERALARLHAMVEPVEAAHPMARAWMNLAHPRLEAWIHEDPSAALRCSEVALASFREAGYERGERLSRVFVGLSTWMLGDYETAERALHQEVGTEAEFALVASLHALLLSFVLAARGKVDEARACAERLVAGGGARRAPADEGRGRWALAEALRRAGDLASAEREAARAAALLAGSPLDEIGATATRAAVLLSLGRGAEALGPVRRALRRSEELGASGCLGALLRLAYVECLEAAGEVAEAREALARAHARLVRSAEKIGDPAARERFFRAVPENARTLELARDRLGR